MRGVGEQGHAQEAEDVCGDNGCVTVDASRFSSKKALSDSASELGQALWPVFEHGILDGIKPWSEIRLSLVAIPDKQSENFLLCAPNL